MTTMTPKFSAAFEELAATIAGTDVIAVLCGHFHLQLTGRLEQAVVWATPGVVSRIYLTAPAARPVVTRASACLPAREQSRVLVRELPAAALTPEAQR